MTIRTAREWEDLFTQVPETFAAVLRALFADIAAEEAPRHPHHQDKTRRTVQDVYNVLWPRFSNDPFPEAIRPLLRPSLRAVAQRARISLGDFSRMVNGQVVPTRHKLESIASATGVSPAYFLEYRQHVIADAVQECFDSNPAASITAYKALKNGRPGGGGNVRA